MIRFLFNLTLARLVEHVLWGKYIRIQTFINRCAAEGKRWEVKNQKFRTGYHLSVRGTGTLENCHVIYEGDWNPHSLGYALHIPIEDMPQGWQEDMAKVWMNLQGGDYIPLSKEENG